jgi:sugar O-acyltransferase (sialic acid O-acetyltransferase NeuD family)
MSSVRVAVLGAGGFARELRWAVDSGRTVSGRNLRTVAFVESVASNDRVKGLPVLSLDQLDEDILLICGIGGMTEIKERVVAEALERGHRFTPPVLAAGAIVGPDVIIGDGSVICAGAVLTTDIRVGEHVAVHVGCLIGHDAVVEDFATLSPGSRISGWDRIGRGAYLGTGACVIEQVSVGAMAVLGAGAVAIRDIPARALAVGVPAVIKKADRFA